MTSLDEDENVKISEKKTKSDSECSDENFDIKLCEEKLSDGEIDKLAKGCSLRDTTKTTTKKKLCHDIYIENQKGYVNKNLGLREDWNKILKNPNIFLAMEENEIYKEFVEEIVIKYLTNTPISTRSRKTKLKDEKEIKESLATNCELENFFSYEEGKILCGNKEKVASLELTKKYPFLVHDSWIKQGKDKNVFYACVHDDDKTTITKYVNGEKKKSREVNIIFDIIIKMFVTDNYVGIYTDTEPASVTYYDRDLDREEKQVFPSGAIIGDTLYSADEEHINYFNLQSHKKGKVGIVEGRANLFSGENTLYAIMLETDRIVQYYSIEKTGKPKFEGKILSPESIRNAQLTEISPHIIAISELQHPSRVISTDGKICYEERQTRFGIDDSNIVKYSDNIFIIIYDDSIYFYDTATFSIISMSPNITNESGDDIVVVPNLNEKVRIFFMSDVNRKTSTEFTSHNFHIKHKINSRTKSIILHDKYLYEVILEATQKYVEGEEFHINLSVPHDISSFYKNCSTDFKTCKINMDHTLIAQIGVNTYISLPGSSGELTNIRIYKDEKIVKEVKQEKRFDSIAVIGQYVVAAGTLAVDSTLYFININTLKIHKIKSPRAVSGLVTSKNSVFTSDGVRTYKYNYKGGKMIETPIEKYNINRLFSGEEFLYADNNGTLDLLDGDTLETEASIQGTGRITNVAEIAPHTIAISTSKGVSIWNTQTRKLLKRIENENKCERHRRACKYSQYHFLIIGNTIQVYDSTTFMKVNELPNITNTVYIIRPRVISTGKGKWIVLNVDERQYMSE